MKNEPNPFPEKQNPSEDGRKRWEVEIHRYRKPDGWLTRYWAVYLNGELLAVVVYRKGAEAVASVLSSPSHAL